MHPVLRSGLVLTKNIASITTISGTHPVGKLFSNATGSVDLYRPLNLSIQDALCGTPFSSESALG